MPSPAARPSIDNLQCWRLPSGLRAALLPKPEARRFAAALVFRTGFRSDPEEAAGLSHFIEHLVFEGGARTDAERLSRRGVAVNGWTELERTVLWVSGPADAARDSLKFLLRFLRPARFEAADMAKELSVIEQEQVGRGYSGWDVERDIFLGMLAGEEGGWLGALNNIEGLRRLAPEHVARFATQRFAPGNAWLVLSSAAPADLLGPLLGDAEPIYSSDPPAAVEGPPPELPPFIVRRIRKAPQALVRIGVHYRPRHLYPAGAVGILCELLGAAPHGRIYQAVRTAAGMGYEQGLATFWLDDCSLMVLYALVDKRHAEACCDALRGVVDGLRAHGLTEQEFEESRMRMRHGLEAVTEDPESICGMFASRVCWDRPAPRSVDDLLRSVEGLSLADVNRTAAAVFRPERCLPSVVGKVGWWSARRIARRLGAVTRAG